MRLRVLTLSVLLAAGSAPAHASGPNPVTEWAAIVQPAIHNASAPRSAGSAQVLHTTVQLAIYDAVMAIEGGYAPYLPGLAPAPGADVRAAVATAAYLTARARVASSQYAYLDQQYATYLATVPDGSAKIDGVQVGERAAQAILLHRQNDGFNNVVLYECSSVPPPAGEYVPDAGCPTQPGAPQPVDAKVGQITPFTYADASAFRTAAPPSMESLRYSGDFIETRDYGRIDSTVRSPEQTDIAYFWTEHPYAHWNRNLIALANSRGMSVRESARFLAFVHTAAADSVIAGFASKYHYRLWRPRTAIPRADEDGNPETVNDATWRPLLLVNHPEYPSGHGFWSGALLEAVAAHFGTHKLAWTITTSKVAVPQLVQTERTYNKLYDLLDEIGNARIWGGLHWRTSITNGVKAGRKVTAHVARNYFQPVK